MVKIDQDKLREQVRQIKKEKGINFSYFAKQIGLKNSSFYNFLCGSKELSTEKQESLKEVLGGLCKNVLF